MRSEHSPESSSGDHLGRPELHRLADEAWRGEERAKAESHLLTCQACRGRLIEAHEEKRLQGLQPLDVHPRLLQRVEMLVDGEIGLRAAARPTPVHRSWRLAAISIGMILLVGSAFLILPRTEPPVSPPIRGGVGSEWQISSPPAGANLNHDEAIRFAWRDLPGATSFELIVLDATGDRHFSEEITQSSSSLPARSLPTGRYSFYIEARFADGSRERSPVRHFSLTPP